MHVPLWAVALVVAAAAPFLVRLFADAMTDKVRKRTEAVLKSAERGHARPEPEEPERRA